MTLGLCEWCEQRPRARASAYCAHCQDIFDRRDRQERGWQNPDWEGLDESAFEREHGPEVESVPAYEPPDGRWSDEW